MPKGWLVEDEAEIIADILRRLDQLHYGAVASADIWEHDTFTVTANGVSPTVQLSYIPKGINSLAWNTAEQEEGSDFTVDYTTGLITLSASVIADLKATPAPADSIFVSYVTSGDLVAQSQTPDTGPATLVHQQPTLVNAGGTQTITIPAVTAGNTLVILEGTQRNQDPFASVSGCGASWSQGAYASPSSGSVTVNIWVGKGCTSGTTVTITGGSTPDPSGDLIGVVTIVELSGITGTVLAHPTASGTSPGASMATTPIAIPTGAKIGLGVDQTFLTGGGVGGQPSGWTALPTTSTGNMAPKPGYVDLTSATGNVSYGDGFTSNAQWATALVVLS